MGVGADHVVFVSLQRCMPGCVYAWCAVLCCDVMCVCARMWLGGGSQNNKRDFNLANSGNLKKEEEGEEEGWRAQSVFPAPDCALLERNEWDRCRAATMTEGKEGRSGPTNRPSVEIGRAHV